MTYYYSARVLAATDRDLYVFYELTCMLVCTVYFGKELPIAAHQALSERPMNMSCP